MPDKPLEQACDARVCIHTDQILDSCMDKDCVEDLRVYLTRESQAALDRSTGAKTRCAELLFARVEVEPLAYKRGHYAVDLTFYYRILGDATVGGTRPVTITGLAVFTKRVALYGGRGKAKTFSSTDALPTPDGLLQDRLQGGQLGPQPRDGRILALKRDHAPPSLVRLPLEGREGFFLPSGKRSKKDFVRLAPRMTQTRSPNE